MLEFYIEYLNRNIQGSMPYSRGPYSIYNLQQAYNYWHGDIGGDPLRPLTTPLRVFKGTYRSEFKITIAPQSKDWLDEQIKASKKPVE